MTIFFVFLFFEKEKILITNIKITLVNKNDKLANISTNITRGG